MTTEVDDLQLVWPAALFVEEASTLLDTGYARETAAVRLLFTEAFAEGRGTELVREVCEQGGPYRGRWTPPPVPVDVWAFTDVDGLCPPDPRPQALLEEVLRRVQAGQISLHTPKTYWSARQASVASEPPLDGPELRLQFLELLGGLDRAGYFDPAIGSSCCDSRDDHAATGEKVLTQRLGRATSWPLTDSDTSGVASLDRGNFLDLIEVFYDLVQRPRTHHWHEFCQEWDYSDHDSQAGQRIYVWKVNALLDRSSEELRLSGAGEDAGQLVHLPTDERALLPQAVEQSTPDLRERKRIAHANAQHRVRTPTKETRREAVRNLGDVLENRRAQAKEVLRRDESDLFRIINKFDIRHLDADQKEVGEEFLDYVYWTLLASLELMNRLEARAADTAPQTTDEVNTASTDPAT